MAYLENVNIPEDVLLSEVNKLANKFKNDISHFSLDYDELVQCFRIYVGRLVQHNPLNLYDNSLSILIFEHMGDTISDKFMEEFRRYEENPDYMRRFNGIINYYQECIADGYGLDDEEFNEMYRLSFIDKKNSDIYIRYLLSQIIEANNVVDKEMYDSLIKRFVDMIVRKNNLNVSFKIGILDKSDNIAETVLRNGTYYILYSRDKLRPENVLENLEFIFHEIWHTVQDSSEYSEDWEVEMFKKEDFIRRTLGERYYDENYERFSYEVDADLHAVIMLSQLLRSISPNTYNSNKHLLERKIVSCNELLYDRKRTFGGEEYDIDVLFDRANNVSNQSFKNVFTSNKSQKKLLKEISV